MSTLKNLELIYAATYEGISAFEEMSPLGEFKMPQDTDENAGELSYTLVVEAEASIPGDPVFAQVTITVNRNGDWKFKAESGLYELVFETSGALEKPKDAGKALEFIEGLNLTYEYDAFEKPTNLEAELSAAYAGYLKRLARAENRGGKMREEPIACTEVVNSPEGIVAVPDENYMTLEELLDGLDANDALSKLLREGPVES